MHKILLAALLSLALTCCKTSMAPFDSYSYTELSGLKVEVLNLTKKATEPYSSHSSAIDALHIRMQKLYEYDIHKPGNEIMARMWGYLYESLYSEKREGLGERKFAKGFFSNWKEAGQKSDIFISEATGKIIAPMFDLLLELESKKIKPGEATSIFEKIINNLP